VSTRQTISDLARKHEAKAIVVYIETPLDIAKQRTVERRETEGHVLFEPNLVEKMAMRLEAPTDQEAVIYIDGLQDAASQQVQFDEQFARLQADRLQ
jgi:predicted kinase